jgi:hypothetical protein
MGKIPEGCKEENQIKEKVELLFKVIFLHFYREIFKTSSHMKIFGIMITKNGHHDSNDALESTPGWAS